VNHWQTFALHGDSVTINAPIDFSAAGIDLSLRVRNGGNIQLNAPISMSPDTGSLNLWLLGSGNGRIAQASDGKVIANQLTVESIDGALGSADFTGATGGNQIGSIAANLTGSIWLDNGSNSLKAISVSSPYRAYYSSESPQQLVGITATNIGLATSGTLTLEAPLTATGTGTVTPGAATVTDTLCTSNCVRPHIEVYARGGFTNNVGASAFSVPSGKYWMLTTESPAVTTLNDLKPGATSFDGQRTEEGDMLLSANRLFHYTSAGTANGATDPAIVTQETTTTTTPATSTAPDTSALTPPGGTGSGGATLDTFPASTPSVVVATTTTTEPAPPPSLIVNVSRSMPTRAGVLTRTDLAAMNQQMHDTRTQLFGEALQILASNPKAADVPDCGEGGSEVCIVKRARGVAEFVPIVKRKIALMIGNNDYRSPIPELETAINDVTAIGEQLGAQLGYEVKVVKNGTRKETIDSLNDLIRNTGPDDSVLVMYAGHGYLDEKTKAGYWIPTDANAFKPDQWISNDSIARALNNIPAKQVMLVSDSCYSGSLTKEGKQTETIAINRDQTLTRRSVLAMSSGGEEPVSDEGFDDHSIFAWNLIQSLKTMTNETSGQRLHAMIKEAVTKDFPQVPQYGTVVSAGHTEGGEYLLTPKTPTQGGAR
jgi:hypothetical protein